MGARAPQDHDAGGDRGDGRHAAHRPHPAHRPAPAAGQWLRQPQRRACRRARGCEDTRAVVDAVRDRLQGAQGSQPHLGHRQRAQRQHRHRAHGRRRSARRSSSSCSASSWPRLRDIPGVRFSAGGGNFGGGALQIELTGDDSNLLATAAAQIERELRAVPGFSNVNTSASLLQPELVDAAASRARRRAGRDHRGHQPGHAHRHQRRCVEQPRQAEPAGPADSDPRAAERQGPRRASTRSGCSTCPRAWDRCR